jgi:hypothetical protein
MSGMSALPSVGAVSVIKANLLRVLTFEDDPKHRVRIVYRGLRGKKNRKPWRLLFISIWWWWT